MTWTDAHTVALRQSLIVVGGLSVVLGLMARNKRHGDLNGLAMALIVVGVLMIFADPIGRMAGLW